MLGNDSLRLDSLGRPRLLFLYHWLRHLWPLSWPNLLAPPIACLILYRTEPILTSEGDHLAEVRHTAMKWNEYLRKLQGHYHRLE